MKTVKTFALIILTVSLVSCNTQGDAKKSLKTELDSFSYALGADVGNKVKASFKEADKDLFIQGFKSSIDSIDFLIDVKEINTIIGKYVQKKKEQQLEGKFGAIKKAGEDFLEKNKTKEGVKVTASGLQYTVLKEGTGDKPVATSMVKVHYHGTLIDGTVFESTVNTNKPIEHNVNGFVKGWTEGLQLMKVGAKYKFFIPQELAYGANPRPGKIKPFMALVFEIELLEIKK